MKLFFVHLNILEVLRQQFTSYRNLLVIIKILATSGYAKSLLTTSYVLQNLNGQLYRVPTGHLSVLQWTSFYIFSFLVKDFVGTLRLSLEGLKAEPRSLITNRLFV